MTLERALEELSARDVALAQRDCRIEELGRINEDLARQVGGLRHQIEQLQRRLYGSKSEKYHPDQLHLDELLRAGETEAPEEPAETPVCATTRRKARPHGRLALPEDWERVDVILDLPDEEKVDPDTGEPLVHIRDEISEKAAWRQGGWYAKRFVRPVYAHPQNHGEKAGILVAPMPDSPIEKCKADNSVLARVAVQKYVDHMPLYRQAESWKREGFTVSTSTINGWSIEPMLAVSPLVDAMQRDVLSRPVIFADDTPVKLLVPGTGRTRTARLWVYVGGCGPPLRVFRFTPDRRGEHPQTLLRNYSGFVHADAYSGFDKLFATNRQAIEVGCWAHVRRKFDEAKGSSARHAGEVLGDIACLYRIEKDVRGMDPAERLKRRQREAVPLLDKLYAKLHELARDTLPSVPLGTAITYATNQWEALCRYTTDGRLEIDNNTAENAIRPLAIGRKNWLFTGSPRGGEACANAFSLLQSAKACGLNPYDYLFDVYNRIMSYPVSRLHDLLPHVWKDNR